MSAAILVAAALAITNVNVIDVRTGTLQRGVNVIINEGRIANVAAAAPVPKDATRVDGSGKFLIPGLWDMHVHLSYTTASALPLLVASGVTGVRDLGSTLEEIDGWRTRINDGTLVGPRIFRVGPILNGKSFNKYQMVPGNAGETRGVARALKFIGVDFLKVHRRMERDSYFALIDEAKKLGIDVVGHIPMTVSPEEAVNAGQATIEHVATLFEGTFSTALQNRNVFEAMQQWRSDAAAALFARFVANGTAFDPTLVVYRRGDKHMFDEFKEVVRAANLAGVMIVTGSDIAAEGAPGSTLHEELTLLVECGLTPLQALQAATLNSAKAMKKSDDYGVVETGKIADVVLLDANPLDEIRNTSRIAAVIANGKLLRLPSRY